MDPEEFQRFAGATVKGGRPVDCRVAIGRAYYAIFNVAADLLRNAGCTIGFGADAHGKVPQHLLAVTADLTLTEITSARRISRMLRIGSIPICTPAAAPSTAHSPPAPTATSIAA